MLFSGVLTAIVTPFKNGGVDEEAFRALIDWQISQGVHGLVPCGTTGESATMSHDEHMRVIEICVDQVKDLAAAGVLVNAIAAAIIGLLIFLPKIIQLF